MMLKYFYLSLCIFSLLLFGFLTSSIVTEAFNGTSPTDFPNYYFAGKRFFEDRPIYSPLASEVRETLGWKYDVYPADPPINLILLSPLSLLNYQSAWLLLAGLSTILLVVSIYLVSKTLNFDRLSSITFCCLALGSSPFLFLLKRNHMESIILFLGVLGWIAARKSFNKFAGALWGLAAALKLFPLIWVASFINNKKHRDIFFAGVLTFLVFSIFGAFEVGFANTEEFIYEIIPQSSRWYGVAGNYSLLSLAIALFGPSFGNIVGWILASALLAIFAVIVLLKKLNIDSLFALSTCVALLVSPLSWLNYLILIFPVLLMTARKINFTIQTERLAFLAIALTLWNWPSFIDTGINELNVLISSLPTFALCGLIMLHLNFKNCESSY